MVAPDESPDQILERVHEAFYQLRTAKDIDDYESERWVNNMPASKFAWATPDGRANIQVHLVDPPGESRTLVIEINVWPAGDDSPPFVREELGKASVSGIPMAAVEEAYDRVEAVFAGDTETPSE